MSHKKNQRIDQQRNVVFGGINLIRVLHLLAIRMFADVKGWVHRSPDRAFRHLSNFTDHNGKLKHYDEHSCQNA